MAKHKVIIEGTTQEIATIKSNYLYRLERTDTFGITTSVSCDTLIEFIVKEPKYRFKTLKELVLEFGDDIKIKEWALGSVIIYKDNDYIAISVAYLGEPLKRKISDSLFDKIFITEE
jgi:hypothetical protein